MATLKSSLSDLKNTNVKANGLSAISDQLTKIQNNLKTVKSDAKGQYSAQISALSNALSGLSTSVNAAKDNLNSGTLASVTRSVGMVVSTGNNLVSAVSSTC